MYIQDKVSWNSDVENRLRLMKTLGVDCVSMDIPDGPSDRGPIDLSNVESATTFFRKAKATVAAHGMDLRTVLATSGFDDIKRALPGRERQIAWLLNAVQAMGVVGIPILAYNFKLLNSKLLRSAPSQGRGGARYISFDYDECLKKPAPSIDPPISEEKMGTTSRTF
jgi:D-mannonate dehydratase